MIFSQHLERLESNVRKLLIETVTYNCFSLLHADLHIFSFCFFVNGAFRHKIFKMFVLYDISFNQTHIARVLMCVCFMPAS